MSAYDITKPIRVGVGVFHPNALTSAQKATIFARHQELNYHELARAAGCSVSGVRKFCKRYNLQVRQDQNTPKKYKK